MLTVTKQSLTLYVDRSTQQWIARDQEGNFWIITTGEDAWHRRLPFQPTEKSDLKPVPGHYKYMFRLPF